MLLHFFLRTLRVHGSKLSLINVAVSASGTKCSIPRCFPVQGHSMLLTSKIRELVFCASIGNSGTTSGKLWLDLERKLTPWPRVLLCCTPWILCFNRFRNVNDAEFYWHFRLKSIQKSMTILFSCLRFFLERRSSQTMIISRRKDKPVQEDWKCKQQNIRGNDDLAWSQHLPMTTHPYLSLVIFFLHYLQKCYRRWLKESHTLSFPYAGHQLAHATSNGPRLKAEK